MTAIALVNALQAGLLVYVVVLAVGLSWAQQETRR